MLLYKADRVPVGDDQRQHLELMRDIAGRFNSRYGQTFPLPEAAIPAAAARITDLQEPEKKMSTTGGTPEGTLLLLDDPDTIRRKLKRAVTDSGGEVLARADKPGVTNLLTMLSEATASPVAELEERYRGSGYGAFKTDVAEALVEYLRPVRERYAELAADPGEVERGLASGADRARAIASPRSPRCATPWASAPHERFRARSGYPGRSVGHGP